MLRSCPGKTFGSTEPTWKGPKTRFRGTANHRIARTSSEEAFRNRADHIPAPRGDPQHPPAHQDPHTQSQAVLHIHSAAHRVPQALGGCWTQLIPTSQPLQWIPSGPGRKALSEEPSEELAATEPCEAFLSPRCQRDVPSFQRCDPALLLSCPSHCLFFLFLSPCPCQLPPTTDNQIHSSLSFLSQSWL